jgi:hypothetical protein
MTQTEADLLVVMKLVYEDYLEYTFRIIRAFCKCLNEAVCKYLR